MRHAARMITTLASGLLVGALSLPAQAATAGELSKSDLGKYYGQRLNWTGCDNGFQCAKLVVPLDYTKPNGATIKIDLIRLRAGGGERIGSLVTNPGGPGVSGVEFLRGANFIFPTSIRMHFDLVSFDPRGVHRSAPVNCFTDRERDADAAMDTTPDTAAERKIYNSSAQRFANACLARSGKILPHVGTINAARDMDVLRSALGDKKLSYLGFSYGTYLGTVYANMYPDKVRALALDSAMDPTVEEEDQGVSTLEGFEVAYRAFLKNCFKAKDCPFKGPSVTKAEKQTAALWKKIERKPLRNTLDDRKVTVGIAFSGWLHALYSDSSWPVLRVALGKALKGDGTDLLRLNDQRVGRAPDGTYTNELPARVAINCIDNPRPKRNRHDACSLMNVKHNSVPRSLPAKGAPPILVIGTTRDPATPYKEAKALAKHLKSGVLLTNDRDGHGAYYSSQCVMDLVNRYLLILETPKKGTICRKPPQT